MRAVSLADIAAEVGMHKSALLKYFSTRDEIYLKIAAAEWLGWAADLERELADASAISTVAEVLAGTLARRPLFCDLIAHVGLNLERTVPLESVRSYKVVIMPAVVELLGHIHRVLPKLDDKALLDLLTTATAVAASLHQLANPAPTLALLHQEMPELGHTWTEFQPTLRRLIETFLLGLRDRWAYCVSAVPPWGASEQTRFRLRRRGVATGCRTGRGVPGH